MLYLSRLTQATTLAVFVVLSAILPRHALANEVNDQHTAVRFLDAYEVDVIEVKFAEGTGIRLRNGAPRDLNQARAVVDDLVRLQSELTGGTWQRSHTLAERELDDMRAQGMARSARPLPDLNLYFRLQLPAGLSASRAKTLIEKYSSVEGAYLVPKPTPLPAAPDYSGPPANPYQRYLDSAPGGIDARFIWGFGWVGQGVQFCDVEYSVNKNHQDLPNIITVSAPPVDPFNDNNHGTAVFGEIAGRDDGTGVKGIAHGMSGHYFAAALTGAGYDVGRAIVECAAAMEPGDIILIEQQTVGPLGPCDATQVGCVPVEWRKSSYDAIVTAVANEIIVIETSGNGAQNLDAPAYSIGNDNHWPFLPENDSGAIIVTGGASAAPHGPLSFTNYGSTVDLQAWGQNIVTTGYGNLYNAEGVDLWYTPSFGGSSGAGPIVAGAAAIMQSLYKGLGGTTLRPEQMRSLLIETGTPGAGVLANSPLPNLQAASLQINNFVYVDDSATGANNGTSWVDAFTELQEGLFAATPGATVAVATGTYWPDWDPVADVVTNDPTDSFALKNGVTVLGGYPDGGGTRDPDVHPTVLSGFSGLNQSYQVVDGSGTNATAVLDGVVITSGVADAPGPDDVGGGIYVNTGSPIFRDVIVQNNTAVGGGGAFVVSGSPTFINALFRNNAATGPASAGRGGAVRNVASGTQLRNVTFVDNSAADEGGAVSFELTGTAHIFNARFHGNTAFRGGAISSLFDGDVLVENAVFTGNSATNRGAVINKFSSSVSLNNVTMANNSDPLAAVYSFDAPLAIDNSILWGNAGQIGGSGVTVTDSIVQGGYAGTNVLANDPFLRDVDGADDTIGTLDDDVRLDPTVSAARNSADGGVPNDCAHADIAGNPRVGACDMGAFEYRGTVGTYWNNLEIDEAFFAQSVDQRPIGAAVRQSADDFIVFSGEACDVTGVNAILRDPTDTVQAVAEIYADASGQPGALIDTFSVGASPGQNIGGTAGGQLWEYRFQFSPLRLSEGTYWVSVYGAQESAATGDSTWVTAGEGNVNNNPYFFREVGFDWVNGGPFFGDVERDLAMEINASCGCGSDAACDDGDAGTLDVCNNLVCSSFLRPPNDDFVNAIPIGDGQGGGTLQYASNDGSNTVGQSGQADVWYRYLPATGGTLRVNTCGTFAASGVDTTLSVHADDGGPGTTANELQANDDFPFGADPDACPNVGANLDSSIALSVSAGQPLLIRVASYDGTVEDSFVLTASFEVLASDSDGDGVSDAIDNCTQVANPTQLDTDGDGFGNRCDGDLNGDCIVNGIDLGVFRSQFFQTGPLDADFDGDEVVNPIDLGILRSLFFAPPGPSALASCDDT